MFNSNAARYMSLEDLQRIPLGPQNSEGLGVVLSPNLRLLRHCAVALCYSLGNLGTQWVLNSSK